MLRAAVLLSFLRRVLRFSTTGRPGALGACYVASWQLPRLDSHQLADDSFQGTPARVTRPAPARYNHSTHLSNRTASPAKRAAPRCPHSLSPWPR